jgi:hypothetical protein
MKFVQDLSKGVLGQSDSVELWEEIISHIPDSLLLKPNVKILSLSCGHCTEAAILAKRMIALGISKEKVNNSMWLLDKYTVFTNYAKINYGFKNVVAEDFLVWNTDMKFDVVVGNPPYQNPVRANKNTNQGGGKKMYVSFMEKASAVTKDDGFIAMVVPSAVFKTTVYGEFGKGFSSMGDIKVISAKTDVSEHFKVGISIGYFISKKTKENITAVINGAKTKFNSTGFYPLESELNSVVEKILNNKKPITIKRDKDLTTTGITTSRFAYLKLGNSKEDTNLVWETNSPEKLKRLLKTNMFARVAWDGFVVIDKRWYHHFWSALYVHPDIKTKMSDDEIMDLYGLTKKEKTVINSKQRTNVIVNF